MNQTSRPRSIVAYNRGFTLLEVILATSLIVGMMGAVYALYDQATQFDARAKEEAKLVMSARLVMNLLTEELSAAMNYPFLGIGLEGTNYDLRFMCTVLPGPAAWIEQKLTEKPVPPEHDVQLVGYRLRIWEDEEGQLYNDGLERICQRNITAAVVEEGEQIAADLIAPEMRFVCFRFFDGAGWVDSWGGGDLPMAVEIHLGRQPLPEGMEIVDYLDQYETFQRVIYVPGHRLNPDGSPVRGLRR